MKWFGLGLTILGIWGFISGRKDLKEIDEEKSSDDISPEWKNLTKTIVGRKVRGGFILIIAGIAILLDELF